MLEGRVEVAPGVALAVRRWDPSGARLAAGGEGSGGDAGSPDLHASPGPGPAPFLLVHGLASNARTWDGVAARLAAEGHPVVAIDQRGHGLSDKPDDGYDYATVTARPRRRDRRAGARPARRRRPVLGRGRGARARRAPPGGGPRRRVRGRRPHRALAGLPGLGDLRGGPRAAPPGRDARGRAGGADPLRPPRLVGRGHRRHHGQLRGPARRDRLPAAHPRAPHADPPRDVGAQPVGGARVGGGARPPLPGRHGRRRRGPRASAPPASAPSRRVRASPSAGSPHPTTTSICSTRPNWRVCCTMRRSTDPSRDRRPPAPLRDHGLRRDGAHHGARPQVAPRAAGPAARPRRPARHPVRLPGERRRHLRPHDGLLPRDRRRPRSAWPRCGRRTTTRSPARRPWRASARHGTSSPDPGAPATPFGSGPRRRSRACSPTSSRPAVRWSSRARQRSRRAS